LLNKFRTEYYGSIISYANIRWSDGNLYNKLGLNFYMILIPVIGILSFINYITDLHL